MAKLAEQQDDAVQASEPEPAEQAEVCEQAADMRVDEPGGDGVHEYDQRTTLGIDRLVEPANRKVIVAVLQHMTRPKGDSSPTEEQVGARVYDMLFLLNDHD